MKQPEIKFLIFDWNGVLINDLELHVQCYLELLTKHGITNVTHDDLMEKISMSAEQKMEYVIQKTGRKDLNAKTLLKEKEPLYSQKASEKLLFPKAKQVIEKLAKQYTLGIVTNTSKKQLMAVLQKSLKQKFKTIVSYELINKPKPNPECIEIALKETGFKANESAIIGDSIKDIQAGKNAGLKYCIGILTGDNSEKELKQAGADYIVKDLEELEKLLLD